MHAAEEWNPGGDAARGGIEAGGNKGVDYYEAGCNHQRIAVAGTYTRECLRELGDGECVVVGGEGGVLG